MNTILLTVVGINSVVLLAALLKSLSLKLGACRQAAGSFRGLSVDCVILILILELQTTIPSLPVVLLVQQYTIRTYALQCRLSAVDTEHRVHTYTREVGARCWGHTSANATYPYSGILIVIYFWSIHTYSYIYYMYIYYMYEYHIYVYREVSLMLFSQMLLRRCGTSCYSCTDCHTAARILFLHNIA